MPQVVGVTFRRVGKVYFFDPGDLTLKEGEFVLVETARGVEFGEVVQAPRMVAEEELVAPLKRIVRVATQADVERDASNKEKEKQAMAMCEGKVHEHKLPMKLLDAEYSFDGATATFSFSAEARVDFRDLVKDLSTMLKCKVQLHQIGVRDEAKLVGGYGSCGRSLCCASYLKTFEPISMKMAKDQSLFLNPAKFSGVCGKLMCCLRYEHEFYRDAQKTLPLAGAVIECEHGRCRILDVNIVSDMLTVEDEQGAHFQVNARKLRLGGLCRRHGTACCMNEKNCVALAVRDDYLEETSVEPLDQPVVFKAERPRQEPRAERPRPEPKAERDSAAKSDSSLRGVRFREPGNKPTSRRPAQAAPPPPPAQEPQPKPESAAPAGTDGAEKPKSSRNRRGRYGRGRRRGPRPGGENPESGSQDTGGDGS